MWIAPAFLYKVANLHKSAKYISRKIKITISKARALHYALNFYSGNQSPLKIPSVSVNH